MRALGLAVALACLARVAVASPAEQRVVLADGDAELRRAVEASLKPWRIVVVVDPTAPPDVASAQVRAETQTARFVVWREGSELVVYDRESGVAERRAARAGAFDAIGAAAAALTVKTMMRLPPPPRDDSAGLTTPSVLGPAVVAASPQLALRFDAGLGGRYEQGLDSNLALRFAMRAMVQPWPNVWVGAIGDVGAAAIVQQASFKGTWSNWAVLAAASYAIDLAPWAIEPWLAAGVEHSAMDGTEQSAARDEDATLLALRGGAISRYRFGRWSAAATLTAEYLPSTSTYTMTHSAAPIFEVPPFGVVAGVLVGADFAP